MEGILTMSSKETVHKEILPQIEDKIIDVNEGAELLGVSLRQTFRLLKKIKQEGLKGLIHKSRGKKSNRGYPIELKKKVLKIHETDYPDYGPTLFSEMLIADHSISLDHDTLRRWFRENAITISMRKKRPHRKKRERRSCFGELLQFDGSYHDWFEGRGAECCAINCIDDATGKIYIRFAVSENTQDCLLTMWYYVLKYGIPRSIYTDRFSVYKAEGQLTDFGRAMKELNIQTIFAKSPQAKGRVERVNRTLQDRLVKALRRQGISNIADANKYVQESFIGKYDEKFAVNLEVANAHRSIEYYDLRNIFCYKTSRQVRNDYTINLAGGYIQLLKGDSPLPRPKQNVVISKWLDEQMHIYFNEQELNFTQLEEKPGKKGYAPRPAPKDHPWRKSYEKLKYAKKLHYLTQL
jgi:transposase